MVRVAFLPDLAPGENTPDSASGAAWSYVLPDRSLGTIVSLGEPSAASLTTLRRIGRELVVVPTGKVVDAPWPVADGTAALVAAADGPWSERLATDSRVAAELARVLAPQGSLFVRLGPDRPTPAATPSEPARSLGMAERDLLWLGIRDGEIRGVVPAGDRALIELVTARWDDDREVRSRLRRIVRHRRRRRLTRLVEERGALRVHDGSGRVDRPPAYVRAAATAAGLDLDDHRWALLDPGSYSTKKILLFLVGPGRDRPDIVVKLVRERRFNRRLEGAWQALTELQDRAPELAGLGPRPIFFGHHAGLALMAESIVEGEPLKRRLGDDPHDPLIGTVVDRLVSLGIATADSSVADPAAIAAELGDMVQRYAAIYGPARSERHVLAAAVDRIGASKGPIPLVLQHGDVGTWNVLVDSDAEPTLIDWEAAVPHGMPLWDLFYFVRSAAVGVDRRHGNRDALAGAQHRLFEAGPMASLLARAVDRFCAGTGLDRELVEPLFQLCWLHRALKASSTLRPDRLARGHYRRLLGASIERRDAPGLRRVFRGIAPTAG
jgi:hypothetical protein